MNLRGDRRINEGERGGWGEWIGPCNNSWTLTAVTAVTVTGVQLILWVFW